MDSITDEYRIIVAGAGWIERTDRGCLRIEGRDAVSFLQALLTNDVQRLAAGEGVYSAYLTPQGRMIADLELYRRGRGLVAGVVASLAGPLAVRFDQLIFSEDARISDDSDRTVEFTVVGGEAPGLVADALGLEKPVLAGLDELSSVDWQGGFVSRAGDARLPMFRIFAPVEDRNTVVGRLERAGIVAVSSELLEALRVDAGRPKFGLDMTEETIPLEAGLLERAISTSKGCYVGQEIIIRVLHRGGGRVARRLVTLVLDSPADRPIHGDVLESAGRDVGRVTSAAVSPASGESVALGYVHRDVAEVGQRVMVKRSDVLMPATVTGLAG